MRSASTSGVGAMPDDPPTLQAVRAGFWGHLKRGPALASAAEMPLETLQQLVAGEYRPTPKQLHQLRLLLRLLEQPA